MTRQNEGEQNRRTSPRFIARDDRLTVGKAAQLAAVDRETIKYAIRTGRLTAETMGRIGPGKPWRYVRRSAVLALFQPHEAMATALPGRSKRRDT
jgi:hypothetical protein